jgi:monovalent cation/hydrogen antiporter
MHPSQLLILLTAICVCALLAHRLKVAPPIAFLLGGLALALVPNMPHVTIDPEYMLVIFLPPILMEAAFFTSLRDFRANLRPILLLAIGLVITTSAGIAAVAVTLIPGMTWAMGFVLGAIVSPPDAAAATAALRGIKVPKRISSILEGESLVNDATGIVLYKFALTAVLIGSFSLADASLDFLWKVAAGLIIGLIVAYVFVRMFRYLVDPSVEILATFIPPYAAYIIAESVHSSGVLAVVSAGLMVGWHAPSLFTPRMRISAEAIWHMVVFFLNSLAFLIIGLQLPDLILRLDVLNHPELFSLVAAVCVASVAIRFIWVFFMSYVLRWFMPSILRKDYYPAWQNVFVVAWTGMRGVVTLALALALPLTLVDGSAFPHRDLIIFLSVSVIIFTLVIQGLSLPWLTRTLSLSFEPKRMQEEWIARMAGATQALMKLEELEKLDNVHMPALMRIREHYMERIESLGDGPNTPLDSKKAAKLMNHPLLQSENRLWAEALRRERETLIGLRRSYTIGDDVMNDILREMDLLASRFHYEEQLLPEAITNAHLSAELKNSFLYNPRLRKILGI